MVFKLLKLFIAFTFLVFLAFNAQSQTGYTGEKITMTQLNNWMDELSNWGRWGNDDELGALNLITSEKRLSASKLIQEGVTVSLSVELNKEETINNTRPFKHTIEIDRPGQWSRDTYSINYHGYAHSHIDALPHISTDEKLYNNFSRSTITEKEAGKLGVHLMKDGIVTRAVLYDIPLLKGLDYLEPGTAITIEDIEAWEKRTGAKVGQGDVMLVRTGRWKREQEKGLWKFVDKAAGVHVTVAPWIKERDIAVLGGDGTNDVLPSGIDGQTHPLHLLTLMSMGIPLLDNLDLEALAEAAAERNRWEFFIVVSPLRIKGGTGSPVNALVIF